MTITTIALTAPIPPSVWSDHPALIFYGKYGKDFSDNHTTCDPEKYYNAACKMYRTDRSILQGATNMWTFFGSLYNAFPRVTRDILTLLVVSDDEAGTHCIHAEMVTTLYPRGGNGAGVAVPQSFVYKIGKAVSFCISGAWAWTVY